MMAHVMSSAATPAVSQVAAGRRSATTAASSGWVRPHRYSAARQPFGQRRRGPSQVQAFRQGPCGPQFGMGMGPGGGFSVSEADIKQLQNMFQVRTGRLNRHCFLMMPSHR